MPASRDSIDTTQCRFNTRLRLVVAVLLLSAAAATPAQVAGGGCQNLLGTPINFNVNWQTQVKPIINEMFPSGRCTSCHNGGQLDGNLDLTDSGIDAIYKLVPAGYVVPGRPQQSLLMSKLNCEQPLDGRSRMPFGQAPLTQAQQELIYDWIAQGALGDVPGEPPIPREFIFRDGVESLR